MKHTLLCLAALLFCGCATLLTHTPEVVMFGAGGHPPKADDAAVEVFVTNKPVREYVEFAQITCAEPNDGKCLELVRAKAREIGADAIILTGKARSSSSERMGVNDVKYTTNEEYGIVAIAIKY